MTRNKKSTIMKPYEEFIDIVDEQDNVIGKATWEEMMDKKLLHRTSNVIIFNSKGEIYAHKRAQNLRLYPSMFDIKIGGSVRSGESYEDAAKRELLEEAGIKKPKLMEIFRLKSRHRENKVNRCVFSTVYDKKIILDKSEVAEGKFMRIEQAIKLLKNKRLSPSAVDVFTEYLKMVRIKKMK